MADESRKQSEENLVALEENRQLLETKLQEIDVLRKKYEDAISNYDKLNSQVNYMIDYFLNISCLKLLQKLQSSPSN